MSYVAASELKTNRPLLSRGGRAPFDQGTDLLDRADADDGDVGQDIDLRQLRHHTKNTLQRILGLIAEAPGLYDTPAGEKIAQDLEYRISLSANISNALFGLTGVPGFDGRTATATCRCVGRDDAGARTRPSGSACRCAAIAPSGCVTRSFAPPTSWWAMR